jgi:ketosteroid isomerase-like protein
MKRIGIVWVAVVVSGLVLSASGRGKPSGKEEIEWSNDHYRELHLKMDTAGIFGLWADDGVDLMPGEAPMIGKKVIQAWVEDILAKMPGYNVVKQEMEFHDIEVSGDWASEWALEHQVVQPPDGKEPLETWGKMALILHRDASGAWKVKQEMWNQAPKQ